MGSFHSVTLKTPDGYMFYPSYFGGIILSDKEGNEYYPWSDNISYSIEKIMESSNSKSIDYVLSYSDKIYYRYNIEYSVQGNQAIFIYNELPGLEKYDEIFSEKGSVVRFTLDRCENANEPVVIGVPYLTMMNILRVKGLFLSMYFDNDYTNASVITPFRDSFSQTSVYYSQISHYLPLTNGKRNPLKEKVILKYSEIIDDVFPENNNPVSKFRDLSSGTIVVDIWNPFNTAIKSLQKIDPEKNLNLWVIIHNWQNAGYDNRLPETLPANNLFGGDQEMIRLSEYCKENGYLFSLHENYSDIYSNASLFNNDLLTLSPEGNRMNAWFNDATKMQSYQLKPEKFIPILREFSNKINKAYSTNSTFLDVITAYNPSYKVDYDSETLNAGLFREVYNIFKKAGNHLQDIHNGPISGEGSYHYLYAGYYDDFAAQIHSAKFPSSDSKSIGGFYHPLFINFSYQQIRPKTFSHGLGYYERFFYNDNSFWRQYMGRSKDSTLSYAATEIAYGHGAFISDQSFNLNLQSEIEINFVYPVQRLYASASPISILYNDSGRLITASEYIQKYPYSFDEFYNENYMSQVHIEFDNGLMIFVNRHPKKDWEILIEKNLEIVSANYLELGYVKMINSGSTKSKYLLPKNNGWISVKK